jgi:hypothetical protein
LKRRAVSTGAALLAAAAWLAAAGCLNPRPEELPSEGDVPGLAGSLEGDDPGDTATPTDLDDNDSPASPAPYPGASEAPPSEEQCVPADAGAPDAGSRAAEPCTDAVPLPETSAPPE